MQRTSSSLEAASLSTIDQSPDFLARVIRVIFGHCIVACHEAGGKVSSFKTRIIEWFGFSSGSVEQLFQRK
jgi:hypothetical protein